MANLKIAVFCVLLSVIKIDGKPPSKIVGGRNAYEGEFPYQVSLSMKFMDIDMHTCGGSIIDDMHILTAAHCVDDDMKLLIKDMRVTTSTNTVGYGTGKSYKVKRVTIHPQYEPSVDASWRNDIAIITLTSPIKLDGYTQIVKLPSKDSLGGEIATASGWGDTSFPNGRTPLKMKTLDMIVIPNDQCYFGDDTIIWPTHLCTIRTVGNGLCTGDSGGPLVDDGEVIGIASFVMPCAKSYPDVFTRVYSYVDWIRKVLTTS